ncbi:MAG: extracellular solute-binding protein family 5 [Verrucomicrobiales bacterium]|nr:extracellular solute-binding protein family 5 [Verrucomicrobiales bacterium]
MSCWLILALGLFFFTSCGQHETRVAVGDREQVYHRANGAEPEDLDPHVVSGVQEDNIIRAILEGLVSEDPIDLHPVPGMAESWDISPDGKVYTFHLRKEARWSNGDPVIASDFLKTYERALAPQMANQYAYMMFAVKNAEEYNKGTLKDFTQVGFKVLDEATLEITLNNPTSYFLSILNHDSWFPLHIPTILKYGGLYERGNRWTRAGHFVGNGPFALSEWKVNRVISVKKNPLYWDAKTVRLNEIRFYPIESLDTEERAFRSGQVHRTDKLPLPKVEYYKQKYPELLLRAPYLGTYFYIFNVKRAPFNDKRVRQALTMAIDRETITKNVTRGGEEPAYTFTPPNTAGYTSSARITPDLAKAKQLLAEAGFPDGRGFPHFEILYNTLESHKTIAEALQQMWKKNLNIDVGLRNEEWKVYLNTKKAGGDFDLCRYGWIGDYPDPNTFLDMWITDGGNNDAGWSNKEYDRLIAEAGKTIDPQERFKIFQKAEAILLDEMPVLPIYYYVSIYLLQPSLKNYHATILDHQPYKYLYLEPQKKN